MTTISAELDSPFVADVPNAAHLLARDEPVLIHLPGVLDRSYCDAVGQCLRSLTLEPYDATVGFEEFAPIPKLGPALFEYHDEMLEHQDSGRARYFDKSAEDSALLRSVFAAAKVQDPLGVLHDLARRLFGQPVSVAVEGPHSYFSGVVRDINAGALPHYDDASVDTPELSVGRTDRQLSVLMYLTDFTGGALTSYQKKPTEADNATRQLSYGYCWEAVQGATYTGVVPSMGSVVAFNPRYLHSIAPISGTQRRLTFSAFIGREADSGKLISWS